MCLLVAMENFSCWYLEKPKDSGIHSAHMTPEGTNRHRSAVEPQAVKGHRKHLVCTGIQNVTWGPSVLLSSQRGDTNERGYQVSTLDTGCLGTQFSLVLVDGAGQHISSPHGFAYPHGKLAHKAHLSPGTQRPDI